MHVSGLFSLVSLTPPFRRKAIAVSLLLFGLVSFVSSPILPLYDGVGFPDEAYRYVTPPPDAGSTEPATGGTAGSSVKNGKNAELIEVVTPENGPQALAIILQNNLILTSQQAKTVHVDIAPIKPTILPTNGVIASNVYSLNAVASSGQVRVDTSDQTNNTHLISLRLPRGSFNHPVLEYRPAAVPDGQAWQELPTSKVGSDIYQAAIQGLGEYAVVELSQPATSAVQTATSNAVKSNHTPAIIITIVLVMISLIAVAIMGIRRSRLRARLAKRNWRDDKKA